MPVDNENVTSNTGSWTFRPDEPFTFSGTFTIDKNAVARITGLEEKRTQKMSEEMALRLHLMMWKDMQRELGDRPLAGDRSSFKARWIERNLPFMTCMHCCFLCEYAKDHKKFPNKKDCSKCPVIWDKLLDDIGAFAPCEVFMSKVKYHSSPISEILALPARNPSLQWIVDEFNCDQKMDSTHRYFYDDAFEQGYRECLQDLWNDAGFPPDEPMKSPSIAVERFKKAAKEDYIKGYEQARKDFMSAAEKMFKGDKNEP